MSNDYFRFKRFTVNQQSCAMKVCTDSCLFGAWTATQFSGQSPRILDIGTGTGLLSLMLAQKTGGPVDAIEIDHEACLQAVENFQSSPWSGRLSACHTAVQHFEPGIRYDLVISNPPFFDNDLKPADQKRTVALHNHSLNLVDVLQAVIRLLAPDGYFAVLLPARRTAEFERLIDTHTLRIVRRASVRQTPAHEMFRVMYLMAIGTNESTMVNEEITIKNEHGHYTNAFHELLRDYYLFENSNDQP